MGELQPAAIDTAWVERRHAQLSGIPTRLWPSLRAKLGAAPGEEIFDAGSKFTMDWDET